MELIYLILIALTILAVFCLYYGISCVKKKKKVFLGILLIILAVILLLFVLNDYITLIGQNIK